MSSLLPLLCFGLLLATCQEPSLQTPTVADAARATRQQPKSHSQKHVLSNEDLSGEHHDEGQEVELESKDKLRSQLEKLCPKRPTVADLKHDVELLTNYAKCCSEREMIANFHRAALHNLESVDFPGKKEWEGKLEVTVRRWMEELETGARQIQAILDGNRPVLSGTDSAALEQVRQQWIEAKIPYLQWQSRMDLLVEEGTTRAKAHLASHPQIDGNSPKKDHNQ